VLVPPHAGVLSALGLAVAPERRGAMASVMRLVDDLSDGTLGTLADDLAGRAGPAGDVTWVARMRYRGQGHELEVPFDRGTVPPFLSARFAAMHQSRYGFQLDAAVEVVSARCVRSGGASMVLLRRTGQSAWTDDGDVDDGGAFEATIHGRRVIALPDSTMLVPDEWTARALPMGGWLLERTA
jgi:N-methylhydantoinase A